ncbi:MAG: DUF2490 domain-containing protein [Flavobacteriaceae bacterium]|nr:DUF2490 domain-containing protein [Flavobacteriaceae bacterium]
MNIKSKIILITIAVLFTNLSFSQTNNSDFSTWFSAELNYKLNKKWTFSVQEQLRLKEDASTTDSYFTQLGATYSLTKNFDVAVGYRYIKSNDTEGSIQGYEDFSRLQFDLSYQHKVEDFSLKYRLRYQTKNQLGVPDNSKDDTRFKTSLGYNIKGWKLDPKVSAEIFNRMGATNTSKNGFSKYRLTIGTSYNTKKIGKFGLFYRFEKEMNTTNPAANNILGLKYSYTIKNKKKKKKKA